MQSQQVDDLADASTGAHPEVQKSTVGATITAETPSEKADIWKAFELLEMCFPAIAPAICIALEQDSRKADSGSPCKLIDLASM